LGAGRLRNRKGEEFLPKGFDPIGFPGLMNVVLLVLVVVVSVVGVKVMTDEKYSGGEDIDEMVFYFLFIPHISWLALAACYANVTIWSHIVLSVPPLK
jgi:hypothetical protein